MLYIEFKDGGTKVYKHELFTDYEVKHGLLVVLKGIQWVGCYAMDAIKCFEYWDAED